MKLIHKIYLTSVAAGFLFAGIVLILFKLKVNYVILFILVPPVSGFIGYYVSRILSVPLRELYKRTYAIRSGRLEYRIDMESEDEVGQLSKAFDTMSEDIKKMSESLDSLSKENAEQKNAVKEMHEKEEHFHNLFENSNDAIFIYDFEDRIVDVNKRACEMLGYPKEVLLKKPFLELYEKDELVKSKKAYKNETYTCSFIFESKFVKSDGTPIDVQISSGIVDLKKGIMQAIVQNITERKELETRLVESEEKFRTFMETASDFMFITDKDGNFAYVNEAMANKLGYSKEELFGMHISEIMTKRSIENYKVKRQQLISMGEAAYEPVWETKARKQVFGELAQTAIYDEEGNYRGSRGVFRDVTERKKVEESQRLANLGKLAADVAHEVNNPVTVISGNAELALLEGSLSGEMKKTLEVIVDQCEQARGIVKRLLMFSRPSKGEFKEANINDSVNAVIDLVESQFKHSKVRINKNLKEGLPSVKIDEKQMQEVFMNLMRNSAEAMPDGGSVTVSTLLEEDFVRIDVSDTGPGIPEENLEKILDPFFTTKEHGTGLGLSVCYGILQAHGGDLRYTSKPGEGTTATVLLPRT